VALKEGGKGHDYSSVMIGPGDRTGRSAPYFATAIALPWIGFVYLAMFLFDLRSAATLALWVMMGVGGVLLLSWLANGFRGHRLPL
jgi:hypothetical protein